MIGNSDQSSLMLVILMSVSRLDSNCPSTGWRSRRTLIRFGSPKLGCETPSLLTRTFFCRSAFIACRLASVAFPVPEVAYHDAEFADRHGDGGFVQGK
jgi:hypothetical protein